VLSSERKHILTIVDPSACFDCQAQNAKLRKLICVLVCACDQRVSVMIRFLSFNSVVATRPFKLSHEGRHFQCCDGDCDSSASRLLMWKLLVGRQ